jgi:hypothetical protein
LVPSDAILFLDKNNNLWVNGVLIIQDLTKEAIDEVKKIWMDSGLTEKEFYDYFDNFVLDEIKEYLQNAQEAD